MPNRRIVRKLVPILATTAIATAGLIFVANGSDAGTSLRFDMARSAAAVNSGCLAGAAGEVRVTQQQENEQMTVRVSGLPSKTAFDLFIIQLPDAPFGVAWYQSDLETEGNGQGVVTVQGRLNHETFSMSQGGPPNGSDPLQNLTGPAVNDTNVKFRPTSQFHIGLWFNSPDDAAAAGCPGNVTPFNGEQHAGVQILSTRNFPADHGPLADIG